VRVCRHGFLILSCKKYVMGVACGAQGEAMLCDRAVLHQCRACFHPSRVDKLKTRLSGKMNTIEKMIDSTNRYVAKSAFASRLFQGFFTPRILQAWIKPVTLEL
jgi:hypothetical protein